MDLLRPLRHDPHLYVTFTEINKVGIRPISELNGPGPFATPIGIYTYPLDIIFDDMENKTVPWGGDRPYVHLLRATGPILDLATLTREQLDIHFDRIEETYMPFAKQHGVEDMYKHLLAYWYNHYFDEDMPGVALWEITSRVASYIERYTDRDKEIIWNSILRRLGYEGIIDRSGKGIIHSNEKSQAVFLSIKGITHLETFVNDHLKFGDVETGHAPAMNDANDAEHWEAKDKTGFFGQRGAGCMVLAKSTGRIMLGLRTTQYEMEQPGTWGIFGGAHSAEEMPIDAAYREFKEETGYTGRAELLPIFRFTSGTFIYQNFLAVVEEEFVPSLGWEHDQYRWSTFDNLPAPLHFGVQAILLDPKSCELIKSYAPASRAIGTGSTG